MKDHRKKHRTIPLPKSYNGLADKSTDLSTSFFDIQIAGKWLSTKEAASYLGISPNALRILVHRDKVKAYKLGARLRFRIRDLDAVLSPKEVL